MSTSPSTKVIAVAGTILFLSSVAIAQSRTWQKSHDRVILQPGNPPTVAGEWTLIETADEQEPIISRRLYKTASSKRLVTRAQLPASGLSELSFTLLDTGETLSLIVSSTGTVATLGGQQYTLTRAECEAYSGANGKQCPPSSRTAAAAFIANASPAFRQSLQDFANTGCSWSMELYWEATQLGFIFFSDVVDCTAPPLTLQEGSTRIVNDFNPNTTPPDQFDTLFGAAYNE